MREESCDYLVLSESQHGKIGFLETYINIHYCILYIDFFKMYSHYVDFVPYAGS
jgi:hypothetical protein